MTCFCLRHLSGWRGNPHYSSFYPVTSELTEGVICGGLGGDAVSGGTGCEGTDDEPGASELAGLLGSKRKQTFVTQDEKNNKQTQKSCHEVGRIFLSPANRYGEERDVLGAALLLCSDGGLER